MASYKKTFNIDPIDIFNMFRLFFHSEFNSKRIIYYIKKIIKIHFAHASLQFGIKFLIIQTVIVV